MFHYADDTSPHLSAGGIGCEIQGELLVQVIYAASLYLQNLRLDKVDGRVPPSRKQRKQLQLHT